MFRLIARYGSARRDRLVDRPEITLGSAEGNDFVLPFSGVSRRHARAERTPDGVRMVDLDSKNGIVVGRERVGEALLRAGDRAFLGRVSLSVEAVSEDDLRLAFELAGESADPSGSGCVGAFETAPRWALSLFDALDGLSADAAQTARQCVLEKVIGAIEADGLWTFAMVGHPYFYFLRDSVGSVPAEEIVERAVELASGRDAGGGDPPLPITIDSPDGTIVACPPRGGDGLLLAASFAPGACPAPWVGHLLTDLAERMRALEAAPCRDDIPVLVRRHASAAAAQYGKRIRGITAKALERLQARRWDGRCQELERVVAAAVLRCPDGGALEAAHFDDLDGGSPRAETG